MILIILITTILVVGICCLIFILPPLAKVCSNCVAISYNTLTREYSDGIVKEEGLHFAGYYMAYKTIPTTQQVFTITNISCVSNDGLTMPIDISVVYKYKTSYDDIHRIHVDYYGDIVPTLKYLTQMSVRDVFSIFKALDTYQRRSDIVNKLNTEIAQTLSPFCVNVIAVKLIGSDLPDAISLAIQNSVNAEQDIELAKKTQEVIKVEAETLKQKWELLSNITMLYALGNATLIDIEADIETYQYFTLRMKESEVFSDVMDIFDNSTASFDENKFMDYLWIITNKDLKNKPTILNVNKPVYFN